MSRWKSVKAKQLLAALLRIGWEVAWQKGSPAASSGPAGPVLAEHVSLHQRVPFSQVLASRLEQVGTLRWTWRVPSVEP
jgi:hypothetical protein